MRRRASIRPESSKGLSTHPLADCNVVSPSSSNSSVHDYSQPSDEMESVKKVDRETQTELTSIEIDRLLRLEGRETIDVTQLSGSPQISPREPDVESSSLETDLSCREANFEDLQIESSNGHGDASKQDRLFLIGGATDLFAQKVEEYDPRNAEWKACFDVPPGVEWMNPACASIGNWLYVIGEVESEQSDHVGSMWRYDTADVAPWKQMQSLITPRVNPCLVGTSLGLYALGGRIGDHSANIVEYYDPERDIWTNIRSMGKPRCYFGAVAVDDTIYAVEGMRDNLCILKSTEQFDPRTGVWSSVCRKPTNGRTAFSCVHFKDSIYTIGGISPVSGSTLAIEDTTQILDLRMNAWRDGPLMNHCRLWSASAVLDDVPYAIGGHSSLGPPSTNAPVESLVDNQWVTLSVKEDSGPRAFAAACIVKA